MLFTIIALMLTGNISYAQNSILAGKIVDENNKPLPGAVIRLSKQNQLVQEIRADGDGLYYSKLLDEGSYHVDIYTDGKYLKAKKLFIGTTSESKKYYIIKVSQDKVVIDKVDEDPSVKVKLGKLDDQDPRHYVIFDGRPTFTFRVKTDSSGKTISVQKSAEKAPKM